MHDLDRSRFRTGVVLHTILTLRQVIRNLWEESCFTVTHCVFICHIFISLSWLVVYLNLI